MSKTIKETESREGGLGGHQTWIRVRKLKNNEEVPHGALIVPDDTPEHDWIKEKH